MGCAQPVPKKQLSNIKSEAAPPAQA